jgi:hypothetical protein
VSKAERILFEERYCKVSETPPQIKIRIINNAQKVDRLNKSLKIGPSEEYFVQETNKYDEISPKHW